MIEFIDDDDSEYHFNVVWSDDAIGDVEQIYTDALYYRGEEWADYVQDEIIDIVEYLPSNPYMGKFTEDVFGRRLIVPSVKYVVAYTVDDNDKSITILNIDSTEKPRLSSVK